MDLKTSLVLVTGATSPAGRAVVEALVRGLPGLPPADGLRIRCLALPGEDFAALRAISERVQILVGDLRQPANAARLCHGARGAVLFHLALARDRGFARELHQINATATTALLEAAAKAGVRRAVVLSDAAVCAGDASGKPLDESAAEQPLTAFGRSVAQREAAVRGAKEIETVRVRCAPLIAPVGERQRPNWFELAIAGRLPVNAPASGPLSLTSPATLAQACLRAAASKSAAGELYWIADEPPLDWTALGLALRTGSAPAAAAGSGGAGALKLKAFAGAVLGKLGLGCASGDEALVVTRPLSVSTLKAARQLGLTGNGPPDAALRTLATWLPAPEPAVAERAPDVPAAKAG
jgi:nucleoside-diphosphate-sugar epimerase